MTDLHKNLKEILDGKTGIVKFPSYDVHSSIADRIEFKFIDYVGISLLVNLKWNTSDISNDIAQRIIHGDYNLTYKQRDDLLDDLIPYINELQIKIGMILYWNIKSFQNFYDKDGNLSGINLITNVGGEIKIHNIK